MRLQQRLRYEMKRPLQADSDLSLADYDVLNALGGVPGECMQVIALAAQIGWEHSRLSHHARRMESRGLIQCSLATRSKELVAPLCEALDAIDDHIVQHGPLAAPGPSRTEIGSADARPAQHTVAERSSITGVDHALPERLRTQPFTHPVCRDHASLLSMVG
jgi:DNA-binding MarR family transcriptional regulator